MALTQNKDAVTGIELEGLYFRLNYFNVNETDFQIAVDCYASRETYLDNARPLRQTMYYTFPYNKQEFAESSPYEYMYGLLKSHDDFKSAEDVLEPTE